MSDQKFDWSILTPEDLNLAESIVGHTRSLKYPDLVIAPDLQAYLFRWHVVQRSKLANVYFHVQVASDPERPLHDHPWDNFSVILSGGYDELWDPAPYTIGDDFHPVTRKFRKGDTVKRKATEAHRLLLPADIPYTMSLFSTGPKVNDWGFWYPDGKHLYQDVTRVEGNVSYHIKPEVKDQLPGGIPDWVPLNDII